MKVLHFILGKANKNRANGVNQVIAGLAKYCIRGGLEVRVIGKAQDVAHEGDFISRDGFQVEAYSRIGRPLIGALREATAWADVVHLHGMFSPLNLCVAEICRQNGRPFVITPHNGVAPDLIRAHGRVKKALYHRLFQRRHLLGAAGVHAVTDEEGTDLLNCANGSNVFCVSNGVDLDDFPDIPRPSDTTNSSVIQLGYLGRLSPEKNLDALCVAFAALNTDGRMRLKLAGPESPYGRNLVSRYGAKGVEWVGPKFGAAKAEFIRSVDLFVHPSLCDVFSIAAMEVLALRTPLLITRTARASYFYNSNAFFMCEPTTFGISRGIQEAIARKDEWETLTERGRVLIEARLNWAIAANSLILEYRKILGGDKL